MIRFYFHPTSNPAKIALFLEETGFGVSPYSGQAVHVQFAAPAGLDYAALFPSNYPRAA